jgi:hypothetical protein
MTEICRKLSCPRNGTHQVGECGPPPPVPDPITQAADAAFGPLSRLAQTEDQRRQAVLFNDITYAPVEQHILLGDRQRIADYLWALGWRREVRPEDITEGNRGGRQ